LLNAAIALLLLLYNTTTAKFSSLLLLLFIQFLVVMFDAEILALEEVLCVKQEIEFYS